MRIFFCSTFGNWGHSLCSGHNLPNIHIWWWGQDLFWISSINDRSTPLCDGGQGREGGEGGNGRRRGLVNSTQKSHFQLPAQKQPQLAVAQSHFLLSVMTLVLALHLLYRQPKENKSKKLSLKMKQALLTAAIHLSLHFPLETDPSN